MLQGANNLTYSRIMKFVKHMKNRFKRDRGIQILGDLLSIAIGTATEPMTAALAEDVQAIIGKMETEAQNASQRDKLLLAISKHVGNLLYFSDLHTNEAEMAFNQTFLALYRHVNFTIDLLENHTNHVNDRLHNQWLSDQKILYLQMLVQYQHAADSILEILEKLKFSILPHALITNNQIESLIESLKDNVLKQYTVAIPLGNIVEWRKSVINSELNNTHLRVVLNIPFSHDHRVYDALNPIIFPIPIHSHEHDTIGYTQVQIEKGQILIMEKDSLGYMLTRTEWLEKCVKTTTEYHCYQDFILTKITTPSCLSALYINDPDTVETFCNIKIYPSNVIPATHVMLENNMNIMINQGKIAYLNCRDRETRQITLPLFAIIRIPCTCRLETGKFTLIKSLNECIPQNLSKIYIRAGFNLPMTYAFNITIGNYHGGSSSLRAFKLALPDMGTLTKKLTKYSKQTLRDGVNIIEFAKQVKQTQDKSNMEWPTLSYDFTSTTRNPIFLIITFLTACLSLMCALFVLYRLHVLWALVLTKPTYAAPYPFSFDPPGISDLANSNAPYPEAGNLSVVLDDHETRRPSFMVKSKAAEYRPEDYMVWLIVIAGTAGLLYFLYKRGKDILRCMKCCIKIVEPSAKLMLKIQGPQGAIQIPLLDIVFPPDSADIPLAPPAHYLAITHSMWGTPRLSVTWEGRMSITVDGVETKITLPQQTKISAKIAQKIRKAQKCAESLLLLAVVHPDGVETAIPWPAPIHYTFPCFRPR